MLSFIGSICCIIAGLLFIIAAFYIQKQENRVRVPGYYTEGIVIANKPDKVHGKDRRLVTFEFTKDFRVLRCTNSYATCESESWREGKKFLIVYDEELDKVYCNPMQAYRKKQAICMVVGGIVILIGIQWSILAAGLLF